MTMTDIKVSAEAITGGIYIVIDHSDEADILIVMCNFCSKKIARQRDVDLPETTWLADIITHLVEFHPERLK